MKKPKSKEELICFSVPGAPVEAPSDLIYHEEFLKNFLTELGYRVKSINEGQAVVFSELEKESFTGIGVSAGGGMCNVCLAFLSVPVLSFSTTKAGDYVDRSVGSVTGESATRVKMIKEASLDLSRKPSDKVEEALHIYYDDLIQNLVTNLNEAFGKASTFRSSIERYRSFSLVERRGPRVSGKLRDRPGGIEVPDRGFRGEVVASADAGHRRWSPRRRSQRLLVRPSTLPPHALGGAAGWVR